MTEKPTNHNEPESPRHGGQDFDDDEELVPEDDAIIGQAFRWSMVVIALLIVIGAIVAVVVLWEPTVEEEIHVRDTGDIRDLLRDDVPEIPVVEFADVAEEAGIDFVHFNGATGEKMLPETMGGGVAVFDYNNDGHQDVLFVNSTTWPWDEEKGPRDQGTTGSRDAIGGEQSGTQHTSLDPSMPRSPGPSRQTMKLYANDGSANFTDVTTDAGLDVTFYGQGVAVGDTNNDGFVDVFFTAVGPNHFFRNEGGVFVNATHEAGLAGDDDDEWSTSAGFFDMDNNGWLDLFVCNYINWSREIDIELNFTLDGTNRAYGPPTNYQGVHNFLYRNQGPRNPGTFTDISEDAGLHIVNPATGQPMGKALALVFKDFNNSGLLDVFVANDTVQNFLFENLGDGNFREVGSRSGVAFTSDGSATGAMGIDAAHYRNDDSIAVGIGNFSNEMTSLYVSHEHRLQFSDDAIIDGIGSPTRLPLTFGAFFFDYDLDGRLDFLQTNGHLEDTIHQIQSSQHYRQPAQLFWNTGPDSRATFIEVPRETTGDLATPIVGRGAVYADLNGNGALDVVLTQVAGPPMVLLNEQQTGHNWLRIKLIGNGDTVNRDAIGTKIELTAGGITQYRLVNPTRSYISQVELPVTFGLGDNDAIDRLRIRWPDGAEQTIDVDTINTQIIIEQNATG